MITIRYLSNVRARLEGASDKQFARVSRLLAYRAPGYQWAPAFRTGVWDGYIRLLRIDGTFPAGLAPVVAERLTRKGRAKVEFVYDKGVPRPSVAPKHTRDITLGGGVQLYPWQAKAVRVALAAHRGVVKVATGGGKTELAAGLIKCLERTKLPKTLVIVPNRNLLKQTQTRLAIRLDAPVGVIGYGKWEEEQVTVAIPNSLTLKKFKRPFKALMGSTEMILLDEAHHSPSETWSKSLTRCNAWYRFGLSGTPLDRGDGGSLKLQGQTGPVIVDIPSSLLVAQGRLAKPTVDLVTIESPSIPSGCSWDEVYNLGIVHNEAFHDVVARRVAKEVAEGKNVLVLVTRIEHGNQLSDRIALEGVTHYWVHGSTLPDDITEAKEAFLEGAVKVLVASSIFGEGTDLPNIDTLIVADGGKSVIKTVQKAGRALRPKKGKPNTCTLVDFVHGTHHKLLDHSLARIRVYQREGFEIRNLPRKRAKKEV